MATRLRNYSQEVTDCINSERGELGNGEIKVVYDLIRRVRLYDFRNQPITPSENSFIQFDLHYLLANYLFVEQTPLVVLVPSTSPLEHLRELSQLLKGTQIS